MTICICVLHRASWGEDGAAFSDATFRYTKEKSHFKSGGRLPLPKGIENGIESDATAETGADKAAARGGDVAQHVENKPASPIYRRRPPVIVNVNGRSVGDCDGRLERMGFE